MKKKIAIEILIFVLIISLIAILFTLFYLIKLNEQKEVIDHPLDTNVTNQITNSSQNEVNSETNTNSNITNNTSSSNQIDYASSDYIFYHEDETGNVQYNREQLNNFEFEITNIPDVVKSYIDDMNEFTLVVKEYVYKNGLITATVADFERYQVQQENNRLGVILKLNNESENKLLVIVNINMQTMIVSDYK